MYLTAHHVWSRQLDRAAVHAFHYRHAGTPGVTWHPPDIARIADESPGELIASSVVLPPGGNEVRSYLDVAWPDETPFDEVIAAVAHLSIDVAASTASTVIRTEGVIGLRFYARPATQHARSADFDELWNSARSLAEHPTTPAPLVVRVETTEVGERFALEDASADRIRALLGPDWARPTISVDRDTAEDFRALRGDLDVNLIPVLTGLDVPQVTALGGIRFERATERTPLRAPATSSES